MYKLIFFLSASILFLTGCDKDGLKLTPTTDATGLAQIKVMYYSPAPNGNYILKLDTTKIGATFFYSQIAPSDGAAYLSIPAGSGQGKFVLPKTGTKEDSIVINTFNYNVEQNKYYSLFVIDTNSKTKTLIVNDDLTLPAQGKSKVRFVNTMYNVPSMDVVLSNGQVLVSALAFGSVSNWIELDALQTHFIRFYNPGTATQLTGTSASTFKLDLATGERRVYTVVLRGIAGSSATPPVVTTITNR